MIPPVWRNVTLNCAFPEKFVSRAVIVFGKSKGGPSGAPEGPSVLSYKLPLLRQRKVRLC